MPEIMAAEANFTFICLKERRNKSWYRNYLFSSSRMKRASAILSQKTLNASDYKAVTAGSGKRGTCYIDFGFAGSGPSGSGSAGYGRYRYNKADQRMVQLAYNSNFRQSAGAGKVAALGCGSRRLYNQTFWHR